jgi:hypothetical protein
MIAATKYLIGTVLMVASLVIGPVRAYPVDDVSGWQGMTWGMTELEVARSMEARGFRLAPNRTSLAAPFEHHIPFQTTIEIDGHSYTVAFQFEDRSGRLAGVVIGTLDDSREHAVKLYGSLLRSLTGRYGPPGATESRGSVAAASRWTFKTTSIALRLDTDVTARGPRRTQVSVAYSPTAGPDQRQAQDKFLMMGLLRLLGEGWRP